MSKKEFESSSVIHGDINDYIERVWSEERFKDAVNAFKESIVIHDISSRNSIVHTDYPGLKNTVLERAKVILTHSPDKMTSEWVLSRAGKRFNIKGNSFFEVVEGKLYPLNADVYHKEEGKYYAGYKSRDGIYSVYDNDGTLGISYSGRPELGREIYKVDLYEDIGGDYFPKIENRDTVYHERIDGRVELLDYTHEGSSGRVLESYMDMLIREKIKV